MAKTSLGTDGLNKMIDGEVKRRKDLVVGENVTLRKVEKRMKYNAELFIKRLINVW